MPKRIQRTPINVALKTAIQATGYQAQVLCKKVHIRSERLSHSLYYRRQLDDAERRRLVKLLAKLNDRADVHAYEHELWPDLPATTPPDGEPATSEPMPTETPVTE